MSDAVPGQLLLERRQSKSLYWDLIHLCRLASVTTGPEGDLRVVCSDELIDTLSQSIAAGVHRPDRHAALVRVLADIAKVGPGTAPQYSDALVDAVAKSLLIAIRQPARHTSLLLALAEMAKGNTVNVTFPPAAYPLDSSGRRVLP